MQPQINKLGRLGGVAKNWNGGVSPYSAFATTFDGVNDYLARGADFTGNADGKKGIFSCWFICDAGWTDAIKHFVSCQTGSFNVAVTTISGDSKYAWINAYNSVGTKVMVMRTDAFTASDTQWRHLLISWDLALASTEWNIYLDGVRQTGYGVANTATWVNSDIDYTVPNWWLFSGTFGDSAKRWKGDIADLYLNTKEHLDFQVAANRLKFRDASGKPVKLGATGHLPTGTAPTVFLTNPYGSFQTNLGTGGGLTLTGALTEAPTSPSD